MQIDNQNLEPLYPVAHCYLWPSEGTNAVCHAVPQASDQPAPRRGKAKQVK